MKIYRYVKFDRKRDNIEKILNSQAEDGYDLDKMSGDDLVFSKTKMGPKKKNIINKPNKMLKTGLSVKK